MRKARCGASSRAATSQAPCRARFGDPLRDYETVRAALEAQAVTVTVPDPASAAARQVEVDRDHLATVLRLGAYSADYAALLPLFLQAGAHGDYTPLAAQFLFLERSYESIAIGMHNSVVCTEDVPFWEPRAIDRTALAATFMGAGEVDALASLCRIWPHGPIDADFHQPLHSAVPALLLSGSDDPVTPPAYAREAAGHPDAGAAAGAAGLRPRPARARPAWTACWRSSWRAAAARDWTPAACAAPRPCPSLPPSTGPPP